MSLGLGLGLDRRGKPLAARLASLLKGQPGAVMLDARTGVYQDAAMTVAAGVGDPVGALRDLSGNGNNATQSVAAARPQRQSDGLLHDGVDDRLEITGLDFANLTSHTILVRFARASLDPQGVIIGSGQSTAYAGVYHQGDSSTALYNNAGIPQLSVDGAVMGPTRGGTYTQLGDETFAVVGATGLSLSVWPMVAPLYFAAATPTWNCGGTFAKFIGVPDAVYNANQALIDAWVSS